MVFFLFDQYDCTCSKIHIQLLSVDGFYYFDGSLIANAFLQNLVLEDSRMHEDTHENRYFILILRNFNSNYKTNLKRQADSYWNSMR